MKKQKHEVEKIIKELSRNGFCVINDVLSIKNVIQSKKTQKNY